MSYEYKLPETAEVWLLDSCYKSDNLESGRIFKKFFQEMSETIFAVNLEMYQNTGDFPAVLEEKNAYSSISYALHSLSPYVIGSAALIIKKKDSKRGRISR